MSAPDPASAQGPIEPSWRTEFRAKYGQAALDHAMAEVAKAPPLSDAQVGRLRRIFTANRLRRTA